MVLMNNEWEIKIAMANCRYCSHICLKGRGNEWKLRIASVQAHIWTLDLQNVKQEVLNCDIQLSR
jgi:hypothetical protein